MSDDQTQPEPTTDIAGVPEGEHAFLVRVLRDAADMLEAGGDAERVGGRDRA